MVPTSGIEPLSTVLQTVAMTTSAKLVLFGGSGEIRTHGPFLIVSFQDWCNKPDSATLPYFLVPRAGVEPTLANYLLHTGYKSAVLPLNYRGVTILKHTHGSKPLNNTVLIKCVSIWLVNVFVTWLSAYSPWLISLDCPAFSPDYTFRICTFQERIL